MKRLTLLIGCLLLSLNGMAQEMSVMTFNIRYNNPNDSLDQWSERKEEVTKLIDYYHPGIFGLQEALFDQITYLDSTLADYTYIGVGRDDGATKGEFSAIMYDTTKVELVDQGTFWLSTTPDEVSVGWDAALPRICTYGLFREVECQKVFWVFNTHFDHIGASARLNSAALIVRKVNDMNISQAPVILMGDLNSQPSDGPIKLFNNHFKDTRNHSKKAYGPEGTFFGFDPSAIAENRIDYIFTKGFKTNSYRVIDDRRANNRHISDHLPVLVNIGF